MFRSTLNSPLLHRTASAGAFPGLCWEVRRPQGVGVGEEGYVEKLMYISKCKCKESDELRRCQDLVLLPV